MYTVTTSTTLTGKLQYKINFMYNCGVLHYLHCCVSINSVATLGGSCSRLALLVIIVTVHMTGVAVCCCSCCCCCCCISLTSAIISTMFCSTRSILLIFPSTVSWTPIKKQQHNSNSVHPTQLLCILVINLVSIVLRSALLIGATVEAIAKSVLFKF